jgi:hypothetical protein
MWGLNVESGGSDDCPGAIQDQIWPGTVSGPHVLTPLQKRDGVLDRRVPGPRGKADPAIIPRTIWVDVSGIGVQLF